VCASFVVPACPVGDLGGPPTGPERVARWEQQRIRDQQQTESGGGALHLLSPPLAHRSSSTRIVASSPRSPPPVRRFRNRLSIEGRPHGPSNRATVPFASEMPAVIALRRFAERLNAAADRQDDRDDSPAASADGGGGIPGPRAISSSSSSSASAVHSLLPVPNIPPSPPSGPPPAPPPAVSVPVPAPSGASVSSFQTPIRRRRRHDLGAGMFSIFADVRAGILIRP
jgi:hypothetical protein